MNEPEDEIIEELYAILDRYAAEFDYDLTRMFADLQKREALNQHRRADLEPLEPNSQASPEKLDAAENIENQSHGP